MKTLLRTSALMLVGFGLTVGGFVLVKRKMRPPADQPATLDPRNVDGLKIGETVDLPDLSTLDGKNFSLKQTPDDYLLCAVFTTQCPGCARDSEMWKDLNATAEKWRVPFYLISADDDSARVQRFAKAYGFEDLHVLFDPNKRILRALKITFVPQYLLFTRSGKVVRRWNGVQNYDAAKHDLSQLDRFFQPVAAN
jgi:peroxiredoxin